MVTPSFEGLPLMGGLLNPDENNYVLNTTIEQQKSLISPHVSEFFFPQDTGHFPPGWEVGPRLPRWCRAVARWRRAKRTAGVHFFTPWNNLCFLTESTFGPHAVNICGPKLGSFAFLLKSTSAPRDHLAAFGSSDAHRKWNYSGCQAWWTVFRRTHPTYPTAAFFAIFRSLSNLDFSVSLDNMSTVRNNSQGQCLMKSEEYTPDPRLTDVWLVTFPAELHLEWSPSVTRAVMEAPLGVRWVGEQME